MARELLADWQQISGEILIMRRFALALGIDLLPVLAFAQAPELVGDLAS